MTGLNSVRRTAISPGCPKGRSFASELLAEKAIGKGAAGIPEECARGGIAHWHLHVPGNSPGPDAKTRALVLGRDGYACVCCGSGITGRPHSIHHRQLRGQGGPHAPHNLIVLCGSGTTGCHGWVHANVAGAKDAGWIVRSGQDPAAASMLVISPHGSGATVWLDDTGEYRHSAPDGAEAA